MKNDPNQPVTSMLVTKLTRDRLKELGKKGETFDDIIVRLLNKVERKKQVS